MANRRTFARTSRHNGVELTAQLPMRHQPRAGDVLAAVEQWLLGVRTQLLDVSSDGSAVPRRQPYTLGKTPSHDRHTACTFTVIIEGDTTPLTLTQYVELTVQFQETLTTALSQRYVME